MMVYPQEAQKIIADSLADIAYLSRVRDSQQVSSEMEMLFRPAVRRREEKHKLRVKVIDADPPSPIDSEFVTYIYEPDQLPNKPLPITTDSLQRVNAELADIPGIFLAVPNLAMPNTVTKEAFLTGSSIFRRITRNVGKTIETMRTHFSHPLRRTSAMRKHALLFS